MTVPSGSVARKGLTPSDRNRLEVGVGLTLCVLSGPLPAPSTQSSREVKTALQCLSRFGRIPWEPGVCREASAQTAPVSLRQPLQLGHVRAALCLSRPRGQDWGGASSPGQPRSGGLIEVRWIAQPLWSLLPPPSARIESRLGPGDGGGGPRGAPRTSGRALCGPRLARSSPPRRR